MTPRDYFLRYIDLNGGLAATSRKLGIPYPTLQCIARGWRGISPKLAQRMADADPMLDPNRLVWIRATRGAA